ncbi:hypothetical protein [Heyndrickxia sporothermodurans]|uniref:hypothetical protein n=1 Tax=Heyndrickxia sporothermodurans TaxID=46224 RepID=UPI00192C0028|nr:hypothetical protein [Heyndrickxia sporothermodurans]MBL5867947.1 hypothetical protein [Heyndrickxia sporothermodurans]
MIKTEKKLESIEEQIKKLKEKQKRLEKKQRMDIGKALLDEWAISDIDIVLELITHFKPQVDEYIKAKKEKCLSENIKSIENNNVTYEESNG